MKIALVAGSSGLVGNQLIKLLMESSRYDMVKAITRHDIPSANLKLVSIKVDFAKLKDYQEELKADDVFCCLGTTMAKARSEEQFRLVDFIYPKDLAEATFKLGTKQFLLVSALGANKKSSMFYNRVKGEIEEAIAAFGFQALHIFRPSLLLGSRKENRSAEDAAKWFYKIFGFLIPAKYKAIEAEKVAKAMFHFASLEQKGIFIHESQELQHF